MNFDRLLIMGKLSEALSGGADVMAKRLLGCRLSRTFADQRVVCTIVETEAYDESDPASHSYRGMTPRNCVMFGEAGHLYVYLSYGIHCCMNIVTGAEGHASAALIRAVEPESGLELIKANRPNVRKEKMLTNGPGKLCEALAIGMEFNGHNLTRKPITLSLERPLASSEIVAGRRIGITRAMDRRWRFYVRNNPCVSA
jgi:DNA-3-methyladenine glycosylase